MKANQIVGYAFEPGGVIRFTVKGHADLTLDTAKVHQDNMDRAAMVGLAQVRIVDMAAIGRADSKGNIRHETDRTRMKWERMKQGIEHLESGSSAWRVGGREPVADDHEFTVRAIGQVKGLDYAAASGLVDLWATQHGCSRKAVLDAFAGDTQIAEAVRAMRAELTEGIDTAGLLGSMTPSGE